MPRLATLSIDFTTNVAQIANDMSRVQRSVAKAFDTIKTSAGAAAVTMGLIGGKRLIDQALDMAAGLQDVAQQAGFTSSTLQSLSFIAGENTVSAEEFGAALTKLNVSIGQARAGSKSMTESFARAGVSLDDISAMTPEQIFTKLQDGFAGISSSSDRAALAAGIFGKKAGPGMAVMLAQGSDSIRQQSDDLAHLGVVLSNDLVSASAQAADQMESMGLKMTAAFNNGVLQQVKEQFGLIDGTMKSAVTTSRDLGDVFGFVASETISLGGEILSVVDAVGWLTGGMQTVKLVTIETISFIKLSVLSLENFVLTTVSALATALQETDLALTGMINKVPERFGGGNAQPSAGIAAYADMIKGNLAYNNERGNAVMQDMSLAAKNWAEFMRSGALPEVAAQFDSIERSASRFKDTLSLTAPMNFNMNESLTSPMAEFAVVTEKADASLSKIRTSIPNVMATTGGAIRSVRTETEKLGETIGNVFEDMTRGALQGTLTLKSFGDYAARIIGQIVQGEGFQKASTGFFTDLFTGIGSIFGGGKAVGGPVSAGKTYLVGERGPELLHMGGGSGNISPNSALGGKVVNNITIVNQSGAQVSQQQQRNNTGGMDIRVMIAEAVAREVNSTRSPTSRGLSNRGLPPPLTQR